MVSCKNCLLSINQSTTKAALIIIKGFKEIRRKYAKCSFNTARVYNNILITHYRKSCGKCLLASYCLSAYFSLSLQGFTN